MSSRETIRTSIRIRPATAAEQRAYSGPSPVQAAPGEVRLFLKYANGASSGSPTPQHPRSGSPAAGSKPPAAARAPTPPGAAGSSPTAAQQLRAVVAAQLGDDYQAYNFPNVFGPEAGNEEVYRRSGSRDVVESVLAGCNGTIFVYGQTGAGKTHTMDAITQLVLAQLFGAAAERDGAGCEVVTITISAVELYNEVLRCLLSGTDSLTLRRAPGGSSSAPAAAAAAASSSVVLEGADERACSSIQEANELITAAKNRRAVGKTRANAHSSRSHVIVRIKVQTLQLSPSSTSRPAAAAGGGGAPASISFSMLNLVDLAGSERVEKSGSADTPVRLREALNINKSLLCLSNVVHALAERAEGRTSQGHIPYRDSKLTRPLEDSLGGNAATALLACITPLPAWHLEQSRATLEFAARAARVVCSPQRNVLKLAQGAAEAAAGNAALVAALQAEVASLKAMLAGQQAAAPGRQQPHAQLQSHTWDSCSSTSSAAMADAVAAAEAAAAAESPKGGRKHLSSWASRLRLSIGSSSDAVGTQHGGSNASTNTVAAAAAAAVTATATAGAAAASRLSSGRQGSLFWKLLHHSWTPSAADSCGQPAAGSTSSHTGLHADTRSLRSAGLLMTASRPATPTGRGSSGGSSGSGSSGGSGQAAAALNRWATFHHGASGISWHHRRHGSSGTSTGDVGQASGGPQHHQHRLDARHSHDDVRSSLATAAAAAADGGQQGDDGAAAAAAAASSAAGFALRDYIIQQLSSVLQQKKREIAALKQRLAEAQQQLAGVQSEGAASKTRLRELAEGIQALAAARQEEFEQWKGHLEGVEQALQAAKQESQAYRQESLSLVQQLTQLQARYRNLQTDELRRSILVRSAAAGQASHDQTSQVADQAAAVVESLVAIEDVLQQLLVQTSAPLTTQPGPAAAAAMAPIPEEGLLQQQPHQQPQQQQQHQHQLPLAGGTQPGSGHSISSHRIHTVTTSYAMSSSLLVTGAAAAPAVPSMLQLETTLRQLQDVLQVVKAAAAATAAAAAAASQAARPPSAAGSFESKDGSSGGWLQGGSSPRIPAHYEGQGGSMPDAIISPAPAATRCHKCDSLKPLLALMQKLKDEVVSLKAGVKTRDAQLAAAADAGAGMQRDLAESRQQVGELQERIDELAEELESARAAAAGAAASRRLSGGSSRDRHSTADRSSSELSELSPGRQLSRHTSRQCSVMRDDTPLPELHAQILLSWHALAMPRCFRAAFVLGSGGPTSSGSSCASPWQDRAQCQAHVALLACLHQLQEDDPAAAQAQRGLLMEEAALMEAGLARLGRREFAALAQQWNLVLGDSAAKRAALVQRLWAPCSAAAADELAGASAAASQAALCAAPPEQMVLLGRRLSAAFITAASQALADAAS